MPRRRPWRAGFARKPGWAGLGDPQGSGRESKEGHFQVWRFRALKNHLLSDFVPGGNSIPLRPRVGSLAGCHPGCERGQHLLARARIPRALCLSWVTPARISLPPRPRRARDHFPQFHPLRPPPSSRPADLRGPRKAGGPLCKRHPLPGSMLAGDRLLCY